MMSVVEYSLVGFIAVNSLLGMLALFFRSRS